ncbi:MAG: hemin uptake protein HemP [Burkholderiales bacterium]|nr:hemin uptake protein HemP [Burkholderiales bacterium]
MQSNQPDPSSEQLPSTPQPKRGSCGNSAAVLRTSSQALLQGSSELEIEHNGALYRLRQTALGKLILTK